MDDQVVFGWPDSLWTASDRLGHPYFMFVVHISLIAFLKTILDITGLGRPLWTKVTSC